MDKVTFPEIIAENGIFVDGDWVESKDQDKNGDVRLIQLADIGDGYFVNKSKRYLTSQKAKELKCTYLHKGDILLARMPDPLGRACVFPGLDMPCITVVDVCIIRPNSTNIDSAYLKYLINSPDFRKKIQKFITGTTRQRISRGNLSKINFYLPTIEEQHRIVKVLDLAQSLIEKRKQAISYLDDYIKAVFLDMFGDPVSNPKGWEVVKFTDVLVLSRGFDLPRQDRVVGSYPLVASNGIVDRISEFKIIAPGIVTGRSGTLGSVQFIEEDYWPLNTTLYSQKLNGNNPVYLKYFLEYFDLKRFTRGAGVPTLNRNLFHSELIQKVPIDLQNNFETIYRKNISLKQKMQSQLTELENNFQAELQRAFRGK